MRERERDRERCRDRESIGDGESKRESVDDREIQISKMLFSTNCKNFHFKIIFTRFFSKKGNPDFQVVFAETDFIEVKIGSNFQ